MASRRYGHQARSNRGYDSRSNSGRGPGPWQDGYQNYIDPYSAPYADYSGYAAGDVYYGDHSTYHGSGQGDHWDAYNAPSYGYASASNRYHSSDQYYEGHYHEPSYSEAYPTEYGGPYQSSSRGYGEPQATYTQQGFDSNRARRHNPPPSHHHAQTRNIHYSQRTMDNTGGQSSTRRIHSPPPQPPRPPSPSYLELANEEPADLPAPSDGRKLLILDLNGTLVFRSAWRGKKKDQHQPPSAPAAGDPGDVGSAPPPPRLRTAHPRPYVSAFRDYLFAPETQAWLDVMVWSSAQPHSVQGMVERVFGEEAYAEGIANGAPGSIKAEGGAIEKDGEKRRPRLVAIWARDTLGLSDSHYRQKVQTVKDLNIPWSKLPRTLPAPTQDPTPTTVADRLNRTSSPMTSPLTSPLSRPVTPPSSTPPTSSSPVSPAKEDASRPSGVHSALSTLLLDDSPLKAVRQPYNHVCIPEYDAKRRAGDLAVLMRQRARAEVEDAQAAAGVPAPEAEAPAGPEKPAEAPSTVLEDGDADAPKKRKRLEKKQRKREERLAQAAASAGADEGADEEEEAFDPTLLAVIGVLDAVKRQRNVAAWIRAGGLWGPAGGPPTSEEVVEEQMDGGEAQDGGEGEVPAGVDEDGRDAGKRKRRRRSKRRGGEGKTGSEEQTDVVASDEAVERPASPSGNDQSSMDTKADDRKADNVKANSTVEIEEAEKAQPMWFEDLATLKYWVQRGRDALEELGLSAGHGIER